MPDDNTSTITPPADQQTGEQQPGLLTDADNADHDGKQAPNDNKDDGQDNGAKQEDKPVVPETYKLTMQEGFSLAEGQQAEIDELFRGMKLTQEQGQQLADYYMKNVAAKQQQALADYQKAQEAEIAAAKADTEIGGTALNESLGFARSAMDKFGGEKFRAELEAHGMANNAEMIRLLARVGRAMQGDRLVTGTPNGGKKAGGLYPDLP